MTSVDSNFNFLCGRPQGAGPLPPVHMRPPEPDPSPLRVDVINGWPLGVLPASHAHHVVQSFSTSVSQHTNVPASHAHQVVQSFSIGVSRHTNVPAFHAHHVVQSFSTGVSQL